MAQSTRTIRVVVELSLAEASVLARAAVIVTSALDCRDVNAAEQGLRMFRSAVVLALSKDSGVSAGDQLETTVAQPSRRAS